MAGYALPRKTNARSRELEVSKDPRLPAHLGGANHPYPSFPYRRSPRRSPRPYFHPSGLMLASLEYNEAVGYLISAADGGASVNLTDPEWRALIYVASQHHFSAPHLRLERGGESVDLGGSDAEELRSALGKALEARDIEEIKTPGGELAYDTIQRVRHVLLSEDVRLSRTHA